MWTKKKNTKLPKIAKERNKKKTLEKSIIRWLNRPTTLHFFFMFRKQLHGGGGGGSVGVVQVYTRVIVADAGSPVGGANPCTVLLQK